MQEACTESIDFNVFSPRINFFAPQSSPSTMLKSSHNNRSDGEQTRARILQTAGRLFAQTGFAETTSKAIATEVGVDLALINYHFGSRVGLYQAVLVEAHRHIISLEDLLGIAGQALAGERKLHAVFVIMVEAATAGQGWNFGVLARELLAPSSSLQMLLTSELQPKLDVILGILSEITRLPVDDPALLRCLVSTFAPCLMLLVASNGLPGPAQQVLEMPKEQLIEHLYQFALAGLKTVSPRPLD